MVVKTIASLAMGMILACSVRSYSFAFSRRQRSPFFQSQRNQRKVTLRSSSSIRTSEEETSATTSAPNITRTRYTIDFCPPSDPDKLAALVTKHVTMLDRFLARKPIAQHTQAAFDALQRQLALATITITTTTRPANIILDSGCGTGKSSLLLGQLYPNCTVVGVDRSIARLNKNHEQEQVYCDRVAENVWLVRAELTDFWRLIIGDDATCSINTTATTTTTNGNSNNNWNVVRHYLLYPNPYPKVTRLKQRWYAHPAFPLALAVSSTLVVRSNWELYLTEFAAACEIASSASRGIVGVDNATAKGLYCETTGPTRLLPPPTTITPLLDGVSKNAVVPLEQQPWTNFEAKYWKVGEPTYELVVRARCTTG